MLRDRRGDVYPALSLFFLLLPGINSSADRPSLPRTGEYERPDRLQILMALSRIGNMRIATVHTREVFDEFKPIHMNFTRWIRISEALARLGFQVDMVVNTRQREPVTSGGVRQVPFSEVNWGDYDVVKTLFHRGFETLAEEGGANHPFIISKLGSVVGSTDDTPGVHFFKQERQHLFEIQQEIARKSRFVSILTEPSRELWLKEHGNKPEILLVPTGVDRKIPAPNENPFRCYPEKIAVYIGSLYLNSQRDTNLIWQRRLNTLGALL